MYRSSPFRSTLNTGYIKLWTCVALDQCKLWTPFGHFCPYFHTPYTLLCPQDDFTFTFRRSLVWKIDNPSTTLSLAPGNFDNPYKGAESAGCQKQHVIYLPAFFWECKYLIFRATVVFVLVPHCEIHQPAASTSCSVMTASTFIWCLLLRYLVIISTQNANRTQISEEDPNQKSNPFSLFFLWIISSSCHRCLTF